MMDAGNNQLANKMKQIPSTEKTQQNSHVKILVLCFLCTLVYILLYTSVTFKTQAVSDMMDDAMGDLQMWKKRIERLLKSPEDHAERHVQHHANDDNDTSYLLILFTTFSSNAEKYVCRNNTVNNWISFLPDVKPVFFSDNVDLATRVKVKGWDVLPPTKTSIGIPILKYMYLDVMKKYKAKFYGYVNGDILFTPNLVDTLRSILNNNKIDQKKAMLIVGQRTNLKGVSEKQASTYKSIATIATYGKLFTPWGEDYFITNRNYPWQECPEVVIGRIAYDNWLVLNARKRQHTTIDATKTLLALHQTTKAGDSEGHKHSNSNYNSRLLGRLYHRVNYGAGITSCTTYYTVYNQSDLHIELKKRKLHKSCFPL